MTLNKFQPGVLVLPEDRANQEVANGFLKYAHVKLRHVQVLPPAGGWAAVRDSFATDYNAHLIRCSEHLMVLLVDFDGRGADERLAEVLAGVDEGVRDRVFVLGARDEPEDMKRLGSYEKIGELLAAACHDDARGLWADEQLVHNTQELERMTAKRLQAIVFGASLRRGPSPT